MSKKLLLADDSITIQKVVELILADEGFEIKSVGDGEHAWAVIKEFMPDIVLADIEMPKMNGYQLCEKIKEDENTMGIPVILLAGAFEPIDEDLLKEVGADDYIVKPFESQELISKINAIFAEKEMLEEEGVAETLEEEFEVSEGETVETAETFETAETVGHLETAETAESSETETVEEWEKEELTMEPSLEPSEETFALEEELTFEEDDETLEELEEIKDEELSLTGDRAAVGEERQGQAVPLPGTEEMKSMFKAIAEEKISEMVNSLDSNEFYAAFTSSVEDRMKEMLESFDLQAAILDSVNSLMKPAVEKIILDTAPRLMEETISNMMEELSSSLKQQIEKIIWETVPDLAETIINREVEEIKSIL
ncbi:MAG: response regulator [Nitrospirota bacterium]|nr:response regulator [Nitrospirota bacterium]